jgi:hypothetical protein
MQTRLIIGGVALAAIAVGAGACHPMRRALHIDAGRPISVASTLDCPENQGDLIKVSESADGHSCVYRSNQGEDVSLSLLPLAGQSPQLALTPLETQLRAIAPHGDSDQDNDGDSDIDHAKAPKGHGTQHDDSDDDNGGEHDHTKVDLPFVHVDADNGSGHDRAKVDVPFVHVDADDDKAHVKVFGVTIDADNDNANVHTNWGSKTAVIKAGPQGAEIRAIDLRHGAADMLFILAGEQAGPSGYHSVGYVARGPSTGPLVVATFKSRVNHHHDFHEHDVDDLVRLNLKS